MATARKRISVTTVSRDSNGNVTVRVNSPLVFSGSVPFNGSVSGTIPAGATFKGRDSNRNNLPDLLERQIRNGSINAQ